MNLLQMINKEKIENHSCVMKYYPMILVYSISYNFCKNDGINLSYVFKIQNDVSIIQIQIVFYFLQFKYI